MPDAAPFTRSLLCSSASSSSFLTSASSTLYLPSSSLISLTISSLYRAYSCPSKPGNHPRYFSASSTVSIPGLSSLLFLLPGSSPPSACPFCTEPVPVVTERLFTSSRIYSKYNSLIASGANLATSKPGSSRTNLFDLSNSEMLSKVEGAEDWDANDCKMRRVSRGEYEEGCEGITHGQRARFLALSRRWEALLMGARIDGRLAS